MPIEFRCRRCGRLLRTGDDSAGKQAQCPECGGLSTVPTLGTTPAGAPPPGSDAPAASLGSDTSSSAQAGRPFGAGSPEPARVGDAENPYQSPGQYGPTTQYTAGDPLATGRVAGPATALMVMAILGVVGQVIGIVANLAQFSLLQFRGHNPPDFLPIMAFPLGVQVAINVVNFILTIVMLLGAIKMKNLENYGLAMTSAIIAVVPCISPCCVLGLPFGIWALVVLSDARIKAAFRS